jgi:hypothetical protein
MIKRLINRAASIHPHNGIIQWTASGFTPRNSGFPLICDPNGIQTLCLHAQIVTHIIVFSLKMNIFV